MSKESLIHQWKDIGVVKLGKFTLKSGKTSPIYIDLREIISYPEVLKALSDLMWEHIKGLEFDVICGVPYTALPMATCMSIHHNIPMLMQRKEVKDYGTKKRIEGKIIPGQRCLIVEDVVTTGGSVLTTKQYLEEVGLTVTNVVVAVNREEGATQHLLDNDLQLSQVMTLSEVIQILGQ